MKENQTVWITKYALSVGITKEENVTIEKSGKREYAKRGNYGQEAYLFAKMKKDAWLTEADAKKRAASLAKDRLDSIEREKQRLHQRIKDWEK